MALAVVLLYLLMSPAGDVPEAEQELTEEMQTPRVPRADRVAPAPTDSETQTEDDTAETDGENETDVQDAAASAQSDHEEKPALTPLQQERYDFLVKWIPKLFDLKIEEARLDAESRAAWSRLNPLPQNFRVELDKDGRTVVTVSVGDAETSRKVEELRDKIASFFAPEEVMDSMGNFYTARLAALVGGTLPPQYQESIQKYHDETIKLPNPRLPDISGYDEQFAPFTESELKE